MGESSVAGRDYARVYRTSGRSDLHAFLLDAVKLAGGHVVYSSTHQRAPVFLGVSVGNDERLGILCYPFRCSTEPIRGRDEAEHRLQLRYGSEGSWNEDHALGRDISGVDITLVLGVHLGAELFVGLDPFSYDPLPMGISIEFKQEHVDLALRDGWTVWERENKPGRRRATPRSRTGLETVVAFTPDRFLDYARFERQAAALGLDPALRFVAAVKAATAPVPPSTQHLLEDEFALNSLDILSIIEGRKRLKMAVRGGVAEFHLEAALRDDPAVADVRDVGDEDHPPDFEVDLKDGRTTTVECKNASPKTYANGDFKVEVQKTRASKNDPASRFYSPSQFDVVAACLFAPTRNWEFRYKRSTDLERHPDFTDRLAALQHVDDTWSSTLTEALDA